MKLMLCTKTWIGPYTKEVYWQRGKFYKIIDISNMSNDPHCRYSIESELGQIEVSNLDPDIKTHLRVFV